ncbi:hypothetical protein AC249_AIPGENE2322 [Exaiptasia diaphana]|nr:hypothetical protein AC249_AIPGENE2322 [Exaiptasia diaphana]
MTTKHLLLLVVLVTYFVTMETIQLRAYRRRPKGRYAQRSLDDDDSTDHSALENELLMRQLLSKYAKRYKYKYQPEQR